MTLPAPNACRHCGIDEHVHGRRYTPDGVGGHYWTAPDQALIKARMLARREARQLQAVINRVATDLRQRYAARTTQPDAQNLLAVIGDTEHRLRFQPDPSGRTVTVHIDPPLPDRED